MKLTKTLFHERPGCMKHTKATSRCVLCKPECDKLDWLLACEAASDVKTRAEGRICSEEGFGASYTKLWGMPLLLLLVVRSPVITGFWPSLGVTGLDLGVLTLFGDRR